ncbi:MAG TPA: hypothetical protein VEH57_04110 [Thermoplasmata archaeon]|nr:hypothetical protein [Thermoplasmata archaeon]
MSVVSTFTYVVKSDAIAKNVALIEKFKGWIKKRNDLFKGLKSYQVFVKFAGGKFGEFVEMVEFETLPELQKAYSVVMADKEYMSVYWPEMIEIIIPGTFAMEIWNSVP